MITEGNLQRYRVTGTEREAPQIRGIKRKSGPVPQFEPIRSKAKPAGTVIEYECEEVKYGVLHTGGPDPRDHPGHPEPDGGGGDRAVRRRRSARARGVKYTEEQDKLLKMAQEGCTYEDIAEELGVSVNAARARVYKYGIQHLHKIKKATKPKGTYFKPDEDELLIRAWRSGTSAAEIGVALGRSEGSIKTRIIKLRDKGIDLPYKKGPYNTGGNR